MTTQNSTFRFTPKHTRRILCVFPEYKWSFGTFSYAFQLMSSVKAFMPPQGILLIAALMPEEWQIKFIDENNQPATEDDMRWADAVFTSGMHIQRESICDVIDRATGRAGPSYLAARRPPPRRNGIPTPTSSTAGKWVTPHAVCSNSSTKLPSDARDRSSFAPWNACR